MQTLVTVALGLGLRRGELLGLRWQDIDLDSATLTVRHQLQRHDNVWVFVEPKSKAGGRVLPLPAFLIDELRAHRTRQLEDRLKAGPLWEEWSLVFCTQAGRPLHAPNVWQEFQKGLTKAGLPRMPLHGLRHGTATMLLAQGASAREIQAVLGHANISTTLGIYAHVAPELMRENADRMQRALVGG
jgi:integrase